MFLSFISADGGVTDKKTEENSPNELNMKSNNKNNHGHGGQGGGGKGKISYESYVVLQYNT